jgi:hypothetical protein
MKDIMKDVLKELLKFMNCLEEYEIFQIQDAIVDSDRFLRKQFRRRMCDEFKINKWSPLLSNK